MKPKMKRRIRSIAQAIAILSLDMLIWLFVWTINVIPIAMITSVVRNTEIIIPGWTLLAGSFACALLWPAVKRT